MFLLSLFFWTFMWNRSGNTLSYSSVILSVSMISQRIQAHVQKDAAPKHLAQQTVWHI